MDPTQRFEALQKEVSHLRTEMETNRKYIFERPLLIVIGGITAAAGAQQLAGFDALPIVFVVLLAYNLSFTYNRLQSNARIVAYLQIVHTPIGVNRWGGWEADLHCFRECAESEVEAIAAAYATAPSRGEGRFYGPLFAFHLVAALAVTAFLLMQVYRNGFTNVQGPQVVVLGADTLALAVFGLLSLKYRPSKVRHTIAISRNIWDKVLPPVTLAMLPNERDKADTIALTARGDTPRAQRELE